LPESRRRACWCPKPSRSEAGRLRCGITVLRQSMKVKIVIVIITALVRNSTLLEHQFEVNSADTTTPRRALIALQSTVCQQPGGPLFTRPRVKPPLHDPSPGALHAAGWEMPLWFWFVFLGFGQWLLCTVYNGLTDTAKERMIARHARWGGCRWGGRSTGGMQTSSLDRAAFTAFGARAFTSSPRFTKHSLHTTDTQLTLRGSECHRCRNRCGTSSPTSRPSSGRKYTTDNQ